MFAFRAPHVRRRVRPSSPDTVVVYAVELWPTNIVPRAWESVAPIVPVSALPNQISPVGLGVTLDAIPPWFKKEQQHAEKGFGKREALSSTACLRATFQADGLGELCLGPGGKERKNYEVSWERIRIANLALWLARPSALHVELVGEPHSNRGR